MSLGNPITKIRRSHDRLIFIAGIPISEKENIWTVFLYIVTGPRSFSLFRHADVIIRQIIRICGPIQYRKSLHGRKKMFYNHFEIWQTFRQHCCPRCLPHFNTQSDMNILKPNLAASNICDILLLNPLSKEYRTVTLVRFYEGDHQYKICP